jgi:hypothetical protein
MHFACTAHQDIVCKRSQRLKPCRRHPGIQGAQLTFETGGRTTLHRHLPCCCTALPRIVVECELSFFNAVRRILALVCEYEVAENMAIQTFFQSIVQPSLLPPVSGHRGRLDMQSLASLVRPSNICIGPSYYEPARSPQLLYEAGVTLTTTLRHADKDPLRTRTRSLTMRQYPSSVYDARKPIAFWRSLTTCLV